MTQIIVRANATPKVGGGHLYRAFAICEAAEDEGLSVTLISNNSARASRYLPTVPHFQAGEELSMTELPLLTSLRDHSHPQWVVIDSYLVTQQYLHELANLGFKCAVFDDDGIIESLVCDLHIDPTFRAYSQSVEGKLAGPRFAPIRREFRQAPKVVVKQDLENILVFFGNTDEDGYSQQYIEALQRDFAGQITLLVGHLNPFGDALIGLTTDRLSVIRDPPSVAEIMLDVDLAVCAGGSILWELGTLGVPTISAGLATYQVPILIKLDEANLVPYLGLAGSPDSFVRLTRELDNMLDFGIRKTTSKRLLDHFDGAGAIHVLHELLARI